MINEASERHNNFIKTKNCFGINNSVLEELHIQVPNEVKKN